MTPEQLSFPLPRLEARGRDAFFVAPSNALAVRQVETWQAWPEGKLVLVGPEGSGKTHLASVWAGLAGAASVGAEGLGGADIEALAASAVAVEDAHRAAGRRADERALFHLHNLLRQRGHPLLLTAREPPGRWGLALADLRSRLEAAAVAELGPPDDALLGAVLVKLFADRQISPPPRLVDYCLRRMDRSFAAAARIVEALDRRALATGRPIGIQLAAEALDNPEPPTR